MISNWSTYRAVALALATALALGAHAEPPATSKALSLAPKGTHVSLALPALSESLDDYVALAKKVAVGVDIDAELAKIVADLAMDADVQGATTIPGVATAKGLDPAKPIALFLDLTKTVDSLRAVQKGDDGGEAKAEDAGDAAAAEMEVSGDFEADPPAWAVVVGVSDAVKAEAFVKELGDKMPEKPASEEVEKGGHTVSVAGDYAHFQAHDKLVIGTKDIVLATAEQFDHERTVRYGSEEIPAGPNEVVALVDVVALAPVLEEMSTLIEGDEAGKASVAALAANFKTAFASPVGNDPLLVTLSLDEKRADLKMRLDTSKYPAYLTTYGGAEKLALAPFLPENILALLSFRQNEQTKKLLTDQVIPSLQASGQEAAVYAIPAMNLLGDEITLGIAAVENDFPAAYLMVALNEPEQAVGLINMLVPAMPAETYNEVEIKAIAAPIPVPLSMATPGGMLLVSNNIEGMKKIIDQQKTGGSNKVYEGMSQPMKADTPRYQALVLKSALLTDVVMPLSALGGGLPPNVAPGAEAFSKSVDEIRMVSELDGDWSVTQLTAFLK